MQCIFFNYTSNSKDIADNVDADLNPTAENDELIKSSDYVHGKVFDAFHP